MQKVRLSPSEHIIYVNPSDRRGKWLIDKRGLTQPQLTSFWRRAVQRYSPTIVLDVGVNYGEAIFSTVYGKKSRVIGIEANEELKPYLERSLEEHADREQIEIIFALASNQLIEEHPFYACPSWTGSSSGIPVVNRKFLIEKRVKSITIDSIFQESALAEEKVLFKIDVEGFEEKVIKGMSRILKESESGIGYMEFDNSALEKAGTDVDDFLAFLCESFKIYTQTAENEVVAFRSINLAGLKEYFQEDTVVHTDFILLSEDNLLSILGFCVKEI